ncbi:hypothetical protein AWB68_06837 [Caballeronia choica]|uniref:Uncharacterized protein n=1 Tax=Caballeronia choica TaxID=326476 RepID=A0A158KQI0_9BURK|nr:hypothetical protein AWB68_06837 [Caballeronia choica]
MALLNQCCSLLLDFLARPAGNTFSPQLRACPSEARAKPHVHLVCVQMFDGLIPLEYITS